MDRYLHFNSYITYLQKVVAVATVFTHIDDWAIVSFDKITFFLSIPDHQGLEPMTQRQCRALPAGPRHLVGTISDVLGSMIQKLYKEHSSSARANTSFVCSVSCANQAGVSARDAQRNWPKLSGSRADCWALSNNAVSRGHIAIQLVRPANW